MRERYVISVERISELIDSFPLKIDRDIVMEGRTPSSASSDFLTNKEQGDWMDECDPILTDVEMCSKSTCDCRWLR